MANKSTGNFKILQILRKFNNYIKIDALEIFVEEDRIILKKYEPADIFNGTKDELFDYCGKKVSKKSITEQEILKFFKF